MKKGLIRKILLWIGGCLIAAALILLIWWQWSIRSAAQKAQYYAQTIGKLIPAPQGAALEQRQDVSMPLLAVEGKDFCGLLQMPRYNCTLPVGGEWGAASQYPCRLAGSIYDGSLQIGATAQKGQFDFYREISQGDELLFTDMKGNRYALEVTDLHYAKQADQAALQREQSVLTIFIKNDNNFEYLILYCNMAK